MQEAKNYIFLLSILFFPCCECSQMEIGGDTSNGDFDPVWDLPTDTISDHGWRDSSEPWCPSIDTNINPYDIWSYREGVYITITVNENTGVTHEPVDRIYYNDGVTWEMLFESPSREVDPEIPSICLINIMGNELGDLYLWSGSESGCRLMLFRDGEKEFKEFTAINFFAVNESLAFSCSPDGLMQYSFDSWSRIDTEPCGGIAMWATEDTVVVAESRGIARIFSEGSWHELDSGVLDDLLSVWGFSEEDIWFGTSGGELLQWDGTTFVLHDWPDMGDSTYEHACRRKGLPIEGMWGSDNSLFFHTKNQLVMYDGYTFTILGYWPGIDRVDELGTYCDGEVLIKAIWGNTETELFLALIDSSYITEDCGPELAVWWDGADFHWF